MSFSRSLRATYTCICTCMCTYVHVYVHGYGYVLVPQLARHLLQEFLPLFLLLDLERLEDLARTVPRAGIVHQRLAVYQKDGVASPVVIAHRPAQGRPGPLGPVDTDLATHMCMDIGMRD